MNNSPDSQPEGFEPIRKRPKRKPGRAGGMTPRQAFRFVSSIVGRGIPTVTIDNGNGTTEEYDMQTAAGRRSHLERLQQ